MKRTFTEAEARQIGERLGIDFTNINLQQFCVGLSVELEHGTEHLETNVTNDDPLVTGKIAWAHLMEIPDYYHRLVDMEGQAARQQAAHYPHHAVR